MNNPASYKHYVSIGRRLLSYLLAFSFVITLAAFLYILISDYQRGMNSYDKNLRQIQTSYQQSISYSLWNFDSRQIESQLNGILNFPGVVYVYIENRGNVLHSAGDVYGQSDQRYSFALTYESAGQSYQLGNLHLNLDYTGLYNELRHKAVNILLTQFFKTFSVSIFVLFIVHQVITRRLSRMAEWASQFSLNKLDHPLQLNEKAHKRDELSMVADAINRMRETLQQDVEERERSHMQLENTKEQLSMAINNAAIGFCRYLPEEDTFDCNNHFANQLASTELELESMKHPMDRLMDMISGPHGVEQRERINKLLQGRIPRIHDEFCLYNFRKEECYFDITLQITRYNENRPQEILICVVDRTKEQIARRHAQELTVSLENKVTQRTEELYNEQLRTKASMQKMESELAQMNASERQQQQKKINHLLLKQLEHLAEHIRQPEILPGIEVFLRYLRITTRDERHSLNLTNCLEEWLDQAPELQSVEISKQLPFSLIIEENPHLMHFLFDYLIVKDPALQYCTRLNLQLRLVQDTVQAGVDFYLQTPVEETQIAPDGEFYALCDHIISMRFNGSLQRRLKTPTQLHVEFSLDMAKL
ncbi:HAMP domain-containing protein [Thalassolituus hydrocarboniclasticus]|uniref:HAMP domain-containing protein n=1 Tax=Thalassolituus hydrocarboniclasticus TaxID=2742796 RepID=A0ABY6AAT6_9GAMM|nr:HAMP domain-containing protein [Thalassolituus hydrocarboniclasticus]UXD87772.1 HAMP domain-containing protein [Thalassolituus hydrocarboniclasticus]